MATQTPYNVDPHEVAKFEELASRWWDPNSEFKPLHDINPLRLDYINKCARLQGKKILDVGCGGGILTESMAQLGAQVIGIDMGEAPLSVARLHLHESGANVDYQKITAEEMASKHPSSFDIVTCMEMLEHVPDPSSIVNACSQLIKPGGHVFFSTINRNPKSYVQAIIGAEYLLKLLPKGTHDYKRFIRPSELETWSRNADLSFQDIVGMTYNPLTRTYRINQDVDVNYIVHAQRNV